MPQIHRLALGAYQTNTYIVHSSGSRGCVIIDPGYEPRTILRKVADLGLTVEAILLTHGHFDHVGAVEQIAEETCCALWMHERDWSLFPSPVTAFFYPIANCDFTEVRLCGHGESISAAGLTFLVHATPGHTAGSVCYACGDALFSGDTLFAGSCGRTDLPGGNARLLRDSLRYLAGLEADFTVFPGHGESTALAWEKRYNPCMR